MATYTIECACGCGPFEASSSRARWKTSGCKKRKQRSTSEPAGTADGAPTAGLKPEDPLVTAVRKELEAANASATVDGQIALHLAKQVKAAAGTAASSLAKELRVVLDRITTQAPGSRSESTKTEDDDPAKAAREAREAKAAAAAASATEDEA